MGKTSLNPKIYLYICKANEPNGQNESKKRCQYFTLTL